MLYILYRCVFRFPSTNIRLEFQSLIEDRVALQKGDFSHESFIKSEEHVDSTNGRLGNELLAPLNVNIPDTINTASNSDFISPMPSPTGTIR